VNGVRFEGYVGRRYGRSYIVLPPDLRLEAEIVEGDAVEVRLVSRSSPS
jgi:hypothetical protein